MSAPVNLNRVRKARRKADAKRQADANAARFGRSGAEVAAEDARAALACRRLDGHRTADPDGDGTDDPAV